MSTGEVEAFATVEIGWSVFEGESLGVGGGTARVGEVGVGVTEVEA